MSRQIISRTNRFGSSTVAVNYTGILGDGCVWTSNATDQTTLWPVSGDINNFVVIRTAAPGVGASIVYTLQKNGIDTGLTVTLSGLNTTIRNVSVTVSVVAGDLLQWKQTPTGPPSAVASAGGEHFIFEFVPTTPGESAYGRWRDTNVSGGAVTRYFAPFMGDSAKSTTEPAAREIMPIKGTITALYLKWTGWFGVEGYTCTFWKNGVRQDGTAGTPNTTVALIGAPVSASGTFSLPFDVGDEIALEGVQAGLFVAIFGFSLRIIADNVEESIHAGGNTSGASTTTTQYSYPFLNTLAIWSSSDAVQRQYCGVNNLTLGRMYLRQEVAPGSGKSYTYSISVNSVLPAGTPSVSISGSNTSGLDLVGGVELLDGQYFSVVSVPSGTPTASGYARWTFAQGEAPEVPEVEFENTDPGGTVGLTWMEWIDRAGTAHVFAKLPLPDAGDYYYGFKEARVKTWGTIRRSLSDRKGQLEAVRYSAILSDLDNFLRNLLSQDTTKHFYNTQYIERMIADDDRRAELLARTVARGVVRDYSAKPNGEFEFTGQDPLSVKFSSSNEADQIPKRRITLPDFPNANPDGTLNGPVPFIYGEVSDINQYTLETPASGATAPSVGLIKPAGLSATVVGGAGTETYTFGVTALDNRNGQWRVYAKRTDHAGETDASYITVTGAPKVNELSASRYIRLDWTAVVNAHHYRIYGTRAGATLTLNFLDSADAARAGGEERYNYGERNGQLEIDTEKTDSHPPATNNTIVSGDPGTPSSSIVIDTGKGRVPVIYTGVRTVNGAFLHEFLVSGHANKAILGWYIDGIRQDDATGGTGQTFKIPGFAGFSDLFGSVKYRDINGHRYCLIYVTDDSVGRSLAEGQTKLTLNVQGIETEGDGTGTLITDYFAAYFHCIVNWLAQSYESGEWLDTPTFADDPTLEQINENSFDVCSAQAALRIFGGYVISGIVGANGRIVTAKELLARLNISGDVDSGYDRRCRYMVSMVPDSIEELTSTIKITQKHDILKDTFEIIDEVEQFYTSVVGYFKEDYTDALDKDDWHFTQPFADGDLIAELGEDKIAPILELFFVSLPAMGSDVIRRFWEKHLNVPRRARWQEPLRALSSELGDILPITHRQGIGPNGWDENPVRIFTHEVNPDLMKVTLEGYDVGRYVEYLQTRDLPTTPVVLNPSNVAAVTDVVFQNYVAEGLDKWTPPLVTFARGYYHI